MAAPEWDQAAELFLESIREALQSCDRAIAAGETLQAEDANDQDLTDLRALRRELIKTMGDLERQRREDNKPK
jgi:hypothetical protein